MTGNQIRQKFLDFFVSKGHTLVPSSSLIPDDPSVLLTTAGMQQFKPYYVELDPTTTVHPSLGKPIGRNACSVQKVFRTSDIEEVGDERHCTFLEMLGNFSFGGYFKEDAINYAYTFITKEMGLKIEYVTIFEGKESIGVPKDAQSAEIWRRIDPNIVIKEEGMDDVFWGPTGSGGPCGPTTEVYCKNKSGQAIEVWNIVFNEFLCSGSREDLNNGNAKLTKLKTPGVDTGMGLERLVLSVQGVATVFETDLFTSWFDVSKFEIKKSACIVADHLRALVFLLADGVLPSNKDRGYILRRIIRRALVHAERIGMDEYGLQENIKSLISVYSSPYPEVAERSSLILAGFTDEASKFAKTYTKGLAEFSRRFSPAGAKQTIGADAFDLYQSFGLTPDIIRDLTLELGAHFDEIAFNAEFKKHREISKAGVTGKFGGHGLILSGELKAGTEEEVKKVTRMHTATHLLHKALRTVLGDHIHQQGSDITPERLRFDFTHPTKMTPDEIKKVEDLVNTTIERNLKVTSEEMLFTEAQKTGALAFFKEKYPETVTVYGVGDFSKEVCGGPHVTHTLEIGRVKIIKEEAVSAGIRRIRAIIEP